MWDGMFSFSDIDRDMKDSVELLHLSMAWSNEDARNAKPGSSYSDCCKVWVKWITWCNYVLKHGLNDITSLHYTTQHYTTQHYTALHYTADVSVAAVWRANTAHAFRDRPLS